MEVNSRPNNISVFPKLACAAVLILILVMAAFARFYNLSRFGIIDNDTIQYSDFAKLWQEGSRINPCQKVGYHLLGEISIRLLGYYDYVLPYLSSFLDLGIIILVFLICRGLGVGRMFSLSASLIYAFIPRIIRECSIALPHIAASFFLLSAFYLFIKFLDAQSYKSKIVFLSGASILLTYSVLVHPTLLTFIPIFGLGIAGSALMSVRQGRVSSAGAFKQLFGNAAIFMLCFFLVLLFFSLLMNHGLSWSWNSLKSVLYTLTSLVKGWFYYHGIVLCGYKCGSFMDYAAYAAGETVIIFSKRILLPYLGFVIAAVILRAFAAVIFKKRFDISYPKVRSIMLTWGSVIAFFLIYYAFLKLYETRFSIPLIPLMIIGGVSILQIIIKNTGYMEAIFGGIFFTVISVSSVNNLAHNQEIVMKNPTIFREMADALEGRINEDNRVLIAPYFVFRNVYWDAKYIPAEYIYRLKTVWKPEPALLNAFKIKYIVLFNAHWDRTLADNSAEASGPSPDIRVTNEIIQTAFKDLYEGLHEIKAGFIYKSAKIEVYEVPAEIFNNTKNDYNIDIPFFKVSDNFRVGWRRVVGTR